MKSRHRDHFPYNSDLPLAALEKHHGTCGPKAVMGTLWYFRKCCAAKRMVQQCRVSPQHGSFLPGLALALKRNGLTVTLYTRQFRSLPPIDRRVYEEAIRLKVPIRPALTLKELMSRIDAEHVAIVSYVLSLYSREDDDFHISPLIGMAGREVNLPYTVHCYTYTKRTFDWVWRVPWLHQQCLIVTDLPEPEAEPYWAPKWLQATIARSTNPVSKRK